MDATEIDLKGLNCPLPVLKLARRMQALPKGARVVALCTDPLAAVDVPHFCAEKGHRLVASGRGEDGALRFEIEKG